MDLYAQTFQALLVLALVAIVTGAGVAIVTIWRRGL